MIPLQFFDFGRLEGYEECKFRLGTLLMRVGKAELCALSETEVADMKIVHRIRNLSGDIFSALSHVLAYQTEERQLNLSQKRSQTESQSQHDSTQLDQAKGNFPILHN